MRAQIRSVPSSKTSAYRPDGDEPCRGQVGGGFVALTRNLLRARHDRRQRPDPHGTAPMCMTM